MARLDALERVRQTLGYEATLQRGYAVVRGDGAVVTDTKGVKAASELEIQFADGRIKVGNGGASASVPQKPNPKPVRKTKPDAPDQGSLF